MPIRLILLFRNQEGIMMIIRLLKSFFIITAALVLTIITQHNVDQNIIHKLCLVALSNPGDDNRRWWKMVFIFKQMTTNSRVFSKCEDILEMFLRLIYFLPGGCHSELHRG